ncbi:MAG: DUF2490 domain-containing protein [Flavobacteriales bacterium]|nr:DUF2490 domain-containing protein [Flavobacteriales bacterium]MCB9194336.1 DUF2490 domain-containing protein [Flavobacteriales bacterium]
MRVRAVVWALWLAPASHLVAQEQPQERPRSSAELWVSAAVEVKPLHKPSGRQYEKQFYRKFRTTLELGYRSDENLTGGRLFYTILGANYRFKHWLRLGLEHRYNLRDRYNTNSQRTDLQLTLVGDIGRLAVRYQLQGQHEWIPVWKIRDLVRNEIGLEWNTRKFPIDPYVKAETFNAFHYTGDRLIGIRYGLGMKLKLGGGHKLNLGYRYDREIDLPDLRYRSIFTVGYEHEWGG